MLKRTIALAAGVFFSAFLATYPQIAIAADETGGARNLTISPPSFELFGNPGESISEKIRVRNDSDVPNVYQVVVEDFKAVGEEGSVDLVTDDQSNTSYSLAKWVFAEPKNFSLDPREEKEVAFSVNIPKNAEPGGHYASVLVKIGSDQANQAGTAVVASRVGSLILLRVSGNVKEEAVVESFSTDKSYYQKAPVNFDLRIKNDGNNHIKPKGTIVITNIFGKKVAEIPVNGLNVLPSAIRKSTTEWKPNGFLASRYTATLVSAYGQQNKSLSASTSFIVMPKFMVITLVGLLVLILILIKGRKSVKRLLHNMTK